MVIPKSCLSTLSSATIFHTVSHATIELIILLEKSIVVAVIFACFCCTFVFVVVAVVVECAGYASDSASWGQ